MEGRNAASFGSPPSDKGSKSSRPRTAGGATASSATLAAASAGAGKIRYYCSFRNTIDDVLASRGWQQVEEGEDFDFVWVRLFS
jgi:hypothetical protein